ncbi:MAG: hypothetical protein V2I82_13255 [Halieaceae bacterium]|nr:hypothetical protein [Halieaceae bacterium]
MRLWIAFAALLIVAIALWQISDRGERSPSVLVEPGRTVEPAASPALPSTARMPSGEVAGSGLDTSLEALPAAADATGEGLAALELEVAASVSAFEQAEALLQASEQEVEDLEIMIEQIKARGEDPADNLDLALERFQPAFFRFQDAAAAYESAERRLETARSALAEAQKQSQN